MNRRDLVDAVAHHTGRDRKDVDAILRGFTDVVTTVVAKGEPVAISGFAKFQKVDRPARMGRNPQTGEPVKIKASKKARITPLKGLKDSVVKPSVAPKLSKGTWPPPPEGRKASARASSATKSATATKGATAKKAAAKTKAKTASKASTTRKAASTRKSATTRKTAAKRSAAR